MSGTMLFLLIGVVFLVVEVLVQEDELVNGVERRFGRKQ